jgi:hypothetical protein
MSSKEPNWDQIEPIWQKWTNLDIPEAVVRACETATEGTRKFLFDLNSLCVDKGILSTNVKQSYQRGEMMGKALSMSMRASFMLGLEYGSKDLKTERSDRFAADQAKKALPMIRAALQPTTKYGSQLIGALAQSKHISMEDATKMAEEFGRICLHSSVRCFQIGLEYSTQL